MTIEQYKKASGLLSIINQVEKELKDWTDLEITGKDYFELSSRHVPKEILESCRQACANALRLKLLELQEEFKKV